MARRRPWLRTLAVGLILLLAALTAACGGSSPGAAPPEPGEGDEPAPLSETDCPSRALDEITVPVAITIWAPLTGDARTALDTTVARYDAAQDRVKVTVVEAPTDPDAQRVIFQQAATGGQLPAVVAVDTSLTQLVIDSGDVAPASRCRKDDGSDDNSLPVVRNSSTTDGQVWASSASPSTDVLWYRRSAFTAAGLDPDSPPETLDEVTDAARALKAAGTPGAPFVVPNSAAFVEDWLTGAGVDIVDHANGHERRAEKSEFDNPRTLELFEWIRDMTTEGLLSVTSTGAGQPAATPDSRLEQAAMTVGPSTAIGLVASATTETMPDLDVAPLPGLEGAGRGQVGGLAWFSTTDVPTAAQAAAWDFLTFLNTAPSQVTMNLIGSYLPNNTRAVDDPVLESIWTKTRRGPWLDTAYTQLTNLDPGVPGPLIGPYPEVRAAIRLAVESVALGRAPEAAIATANAAIDAALRSYEPGTD